LTLDTRVKLRRKYVWCPDDEDDPLTAEELADLKDTPLV
jgi:hypothetical protein